MPACTQCHDGTYQESGCTPYMDTLCLPCPRAVRFAIRPGHAPRATVVITCHRVAARHVAFAPKALLKP